MILIYVNGANKEYLSPDIINECITLMGHQLLRNLLSRIHDAEIFSILADETRDDGS